MSSLHENSAVVHRFAKLDTQELVILAFLDADRPEDGIEQDWSVWPAWTDADRWVPNEFGDHTPEDEAEVPILFGLDETEVGEYVLDDDGAPRDRWCPSRIAAVEYEYQELR